MVRQKGFAHFILIIVVLIVGALALIFLGNNKNSKELIRTFVNKSEYVEAFYEEIPGSKFHSPDGTWWGYNQIKIVRYNNIVFSYFIDNLDEKTETSSQFTILKKQGDGIGKRELRLQHLALEIF